MTHAFYGKVIQMNSELKIIKWDFRMDDNVLEKMLLMEDEDIQKILSLRNVEKRIILRTCNRLEIYYHEDADFEDSDFKKSEVIVGEEAIRHIFRVASGLESMSVGENEILRQIKEAFDLSHKLGRTDKFLSMVFQRALKVGKEVRETTEISHGKVSIPSIMIDQMEGKNLVKGKSIGVIGTGKMAATVVKYLRKKEGARITIYGRNEEAGMELSNLFKVEFKKSLDLPSIIEECDALITATSSKVPLINREIIEKIDKKILLVDISNPKNIEESYNKPNVELINLEMANQILQENKKRKEKDIKIAEEIIEKEIEKIYSKIAEGEIEWYITMRYSNSRNLLASELARFKHNIDSGMSVSESAELLGNSLINKIMAPETLTLKQLIRKNNVDSVRKYLASIMNFTDSDLKSEDLEVNQNQQLQSHQ